jgi:hypothetical protein
LSDATHGLEFLEQLAKKWCDFLPRIFIRGHPEDDSLGCVLQRNCRDSVASLGIITGVGELVEESAAELRIAELGRVGCFIGTRTTGYEIATVSIENVK